MTDLSIVIVTFHEAPAVLRACFASLAGRDAEVIVVDNGSREETRMLLGEVLPAATYCANSENRGFAAAVNQGMRQSHGRYVLLLNPDTVVPGETLATMVANMDRDADVGVGSCVIRYPDGTLQESIRRFPTLANQLVVLLKLPHIFPGAVRHYMMRDVDPLQEQDVDSIMGAFMLIRRAVLDEVGLFDERYFIWFEEVDYCKMVRNAGWKVRHYANAHVIHHKGHMFDQLATVRKQRWVRESMRKYFAKHHGVAAWLVLWGLAPVFIGLGYLAALVKRR